MQLLVGVIALPLLLPLFFPEPLLVLALRLPFLVRFATDDFEMGFFVGGEG